MKDQAAPDKPTVSAVTEDGRVFPSWEALVASEANGYVAVAVMTNGRETWPWVAGPYDLKGEAENARARMRGRFRAEERQREANGDRPYSAQFFVRPAWKDESTRVR